MWYEVAFNNRTGWVPHRLNDRTFATPVTTGRNDRVIMVSNPHNMNNTNSIANVWGNGTPGHANPNLRGGILRDVSGTGNHRTFSEITSVSNPLSGTHAIGEMRGLVDGSIVTLDWQPPIELPQGMYMNGSNPRNADGHLDKCS